MKEFKFKKSWEPKIDLTVLSQLGDEAMFSPTAPRPWVRNLYHDHKANKVQLRIEAAKNDNDVPEVSQLNAIHYLLNHEDEIYQSIYQNLLEKVYPFYEDVFGEDMQEYAPLAGIDTLPKVLGLQLITVHLMNRNQMSWCSYMFKWNGDQEHGLSMLFEGSKFLKNSQASDMRFNEIIPDAELEPLEKAWYQKMPMKMYYPNETLNSYKPWQLERTKDYLIDLLRNEKLDEFKRLVSQKEFDVNQRFPEEAHAPLIEEVVRNGFLDAARYLFSLGANINGLIHLGNYYYENSFRIEFVNSVNGDIDEKNDENLSLIESYLNVAKKEHGYDNLKSIDLYKKHIILLLKYGAKIEDEDNYEEVLKFMDLWNRDG